MFTRQQALFDLLTYHRALISGRLEEAAQIERKYGLQGHPPAVVSVGLEAASKGLDHQAAIEDHLEGSE